jgi:hypothetical protein
MQARPTYFRVFVVALIASLWVSACGGGTSGKTWFNLPSIPINIQPDGSTSVLGFNLGAVLPAQVVQQLQTAGTQKLEIRIGYHGVQIYNNGAALPYVAWTADSVSTLQDVLRDLPNIPNGDTIASALPWLRTIGLGLTLDMPGSDSIEAWSGDPPSVTTGEAPPGPAIGPLQIGSVAFDPSGNLNVGSVPGSALGLSGPVLDPGTLALLQSLGLEKLQITTQPNGINLSMNDRPLPSIAYDSQSLAQAQALAAAVAPEMAPTLDTVLPNLQGAQLDVAVSFTGQPAGTTALGTVPVVLNNDGTLSAYGVQLPGGPMVPADVMEKLQQAGVQTLNVELGQEGLFLAANGQTLPTITWTPESLNTLGSVVAPLAGVSSDLINSALSLINETGGIQAAVAVGGGEPVATEINRTLAVSSTEGGPVVRLIANVQGGAIESVEGLGSLSDLGVGPVALPPNVTQILDQLGASQVTINTDAGKVDILLDGATALTLNWDEPSLQTALTLAAPFLAGTPLEDPTVAQLVQEEIVPVLPTADVDVTLNLN